MRFVIKDKMIFLTILVQIRRANHRTPCNFFNWQGVLITARLADLRRVWRRGRAIARLI